MSEKFKNKYRIPPARLYFWDYGTNATYFITFCAQNHECFFGHISGEKMCLNPVGKIVQKHWQEVPEKFEFAALGEFVVMPNHMHGIILINKPPDVETR